MPFARTVKTAVKNALGLLLPQALVWKAAVRDKVLITLDDGPDPRHSQRLLQLFRSENVKVTYFLSGSNVVQYPDLVRQMMVEGHEVANHGFAHKKKGQLSLREYISNVEAGQEALERVAGKKLPRNFRPPHGYVHPVAFLYLILKGHRFVLWSKDSNDSEILRSDGLIERFKGLEVCGGDILLFHEDQSQTCQAFPEILRICRERHLSTSLLSGTT